MGAIVGGIFGGLTGCWYAYQTGSILVIPMVALTSGGSFGFFMGVGMIMRSEMEGKNIDEDEEAEEALTYQICSFNAEEDKVQYTSIN